MDNKRKFPQIDKNDIKQCQTKFSFLILNQVKSIHQIKQNIINLTSKGQIEQNFIRPFAWKIYLNLLPSDPETTFLDWLKAVQNERKIYKQKVKQFSSIKKLKGDPLGNNQAESNKVWNEVYEDGEMKRLISLDVDRTYQDRDLFCDNIIKDIEKDILFIWSKENKIPGYKQGINEILAMFIYAMYPFYVTNNHKGKYTNEEFELYSKEPKEHIKELYEFFHDENELTSDLYLMLSSLMKKGASRFFEDKPPYENNLSNDTNHNFESYLVNRCNHIVHTKLRLFDNRLYCHFNNVQLDCEIIVQRWLKCLFDREFHPKDVSGFWDAILCDEFLKGTKDLELVDFMCIAMFSYIREELVVKDQNECFQRLFKYPPIESPKVIVDLALKLRNEIKKKMLDEEKIEKEKKEKKEKRKKEMEEKIEKIKNISNGINDKNGNKNNNNVNSTNDNKNGINNTKNCINSNLDLSSYDNILDKGFKTDIHELKQIINKYKSVMDAMDSMKIDSIFLKIEKDLN